MTQMLAVARRHAMLLLVLAGYAATAVLRPAALWPATQTTASLLGQIGLILVAAYCFLGLFEEWVSPALLARSIGRDAGRLRALSVATVAGACATGPVYLTYPLAMLFAGAGARVATIVAFMSSWQIVKLTFLPFEIQFLGARFAVLRFACAVLVPIPAGLLTEAVLRLCGVSTLSRTPPER